MDTSTTYITNQPSAICSFTSATYAAAQPASKPSRCHTICGLASDATEVTVACIRSSSSTEPGLCSGTSIDGSDSFYISISVSNVIAEYTSLAASKLRIDVSTSARCTPAKKQHSRSSRFPAYTASNSIPLPSTAATSPTTASAPRSTEQSSPISTCADCRTDVRYDDT